MNRSPLRNSRLRPFLAGFAVCACLLPLAAQKPATQSASGLGLDTRGQLSAGPTYTSADGKGAPQFPEMDLVFTLRGPDGRPIPVHPGELALFAQGQQIAACTGIRSFDRTGYGLTTVVVLDSSGAMRTAPNGAFDSVLSGLARQARPQDRVAIVTLAEDSHVELPFRAPSATPAPAALNLRPRGASTRLYDGLLDALAIFPSAPARRRQLVLISDGRDQGSQHTLADVVLRARSLGVAIDAIGMAQGVDNELVTLQQLALATGGVYLRAQSPEQLQQILSLGAAAALATPVAAFQLSHIPADGQLVSIQLRWLRGGLSAPAFLQTPKMPTPLPPLLQSISTRVLGPLRHLSIWILAFGGSFLLGVLLFLLSFRRPRQQAPIETPPAPAPPPLNQPSPQQLYQATSRYRADYRPRFVEAEVERRKSEYAARFDPPPNGPFARLTVRNNTLAGKSFLIHHTGFSIGALPGNDLALPGDLTISGRHVRLYWENGVLLIEDNHSTNGTYLNRLRLPAGRHPLKPGDEIGLGQTFLLVDRAG